jgi:YD repeat-containing protein
VSLQTVPNAPQCPPNAPVHADQFLGDFGQQQLLGQQRGAVRRRGGAGAGRGGAGAGRGGAGNLLQIGGYQYGYDGENRLISSSANGTSYGYDADGRRVLKQSSGVTTVYVYDVKGAEGAQRDSLT